MSMWHRRVADVNGIGKTIIDVKCDQVLLMSVSVSVFALVPIIIVVAAAAIIVLGVVSDVNVGICVIHVMKGDAMRRRSDAILPGVGGVVVAIFVVLVLVLVMTVVIP